MPKWDKDSIVAEIRRRHREGLSLAYNTAKVDAQALVSAGAYHFGGYRKAVEAAGFSYREVNGRKWDKQAIIEGIQAARGRGDPLHWTAANVRESTKLIAFASIYHFGSWENALREAGIEPASVSPYQRWTPDRVTAELEKRTGPCSLSPRSLQADDTSLHSAAIRYFGTLSDAIAATSLSATEVQYRTFAPIGITVRRRRYGNVALRSLVSLKAACGAPDEAECWIWPGWKDQNGYTRIAGIYGHRASYIRFNGPVLAGEVVRHTCDNPPCVNPTHLLRGTQADNVRDREERGRSNRGRRFSIDEVALIRDTAATSADVSRLAKELGVSAGCVYAVKQGRTYKGVG